MAGLAVRAAGLSLCLLLASGNCMACFAAPAEQRVPVDELIARTPDIVLATVVRAAQVEAGRVVYSFRVTRHVRGHAADEFDIQSDLAGRGGESRTFAHHTDAAFWENGGGRISNYVDCEIHPNFAVGATYLIFLSEPYHVKSFEQIMRTFGDEKDKWLSYVEGKTGTLNSFRPSPHRPAWLRIEK
jgi:hypothetical protein